MYGIISVNFSAEITVLFFLFFVCHTMIYVPLNKRWFFPQFEGIEALVGKAIENVLNDYLPSFR